MPTLSTNAPTLAVDGDRLVLAARPATGGAVPFTATLTDDNGWSLAITGNYTVEKTTALPNANAVTLNADPVTLNSDPVTLGAV